MYLYRAMGFENIQLPSAVLSGLYKQVVVTDDYAQLSGNRENRIEENAPVAKTTPVMAPASGNMQAQDAGSSPASSTAASAEAQPGVAAQPQAQQTGQVYGNAGNAPAYAPAQPAASGWSTGPSLPTAPPESAGPYRFLGKNARHIAIVVFSPNDAYLPDDQLQLLTKMLDACRLNLGDVAIINQSSQVVHFTHLGDQLRSEKVLLFGVQPEQIGLPMNFPSYKEQEYAGTTYLLANPLGDMNQPNEEGKALKGKLWGCLKKMFNI